LMPFPAALASILLAARRCLKPGTDQADWAAS
jgi:hypothetical protein